ncbi:MAG: TetR/AcrR family transcriptional regulator [Bryobacterales bacterium]|nr:TetR/AcrR family transcriptional regulator [Bryobacterales bacterium]
MKIGSGSYEFSLRQDQMAQTHERILAALGELIRPDGFEEVSYRALAREARVTEITVYRHFKDHHELLRAFWSWTDAKLGNRGMPRSEESLIADITPVLIGFDEQEQLMRAALLTSEGRAMRMSVKAERRACFEMALTGATEGLAPEERRRVAAVIQLLYSGYAWLSMRDHWGLTGKAK